MPNEKILSAVKFAKEDFVKAGKKFETKGAALERRANSTTIAISYDGSYERDKARGLIREGLVISKDYFVACETIVGSLDAICRPLLALKPSVQAVGAVASLIDEIVKDLDETRVTFNAYFDGSKGGSAESEAFKPSIESRIIQSFWNNEYRIMPGYAEEEKRRKEEKLLAQKKEKEAKLLKEQAKTKFFEQMEDMLESDRAVEEKRKALKEECERAVKEFEEKANGSLDAFVADAPKRAAEEIEALDKRIAEIRANMKRADKSSKAKYADEIKDIEDEKIIVEMPQYIQIQTELGKSKIEKAVEEYKAQLDAYIEKCFSKKKKDYEVCTPSKQENLAAKDIDGEDWIAWSYVNEKGYLKLSDIDDEYYNTHRSEILRSISKLERNGDIYRVKFTDATYYALPETSVRHTAEVWVEKTADPVKGLPKPTPIDFAHKQGNTAGRKSSARAENKPDRIAEYKKEQKLELAKCRAAKKERNKKAAIAICMIALIIAAICIAPSVFSSIRFGQADKLFAEGKYDEAIRIYGELDGFGESKKRIATIKAIEEIEKGRPEASVKKLLEAGVPVEVTYDTQGGKNGTYTETYNNSSDFGGLCSPEKTGYRFWGWKIEGHSYEMDGIFKITVKASWSVTEYNLTLNGVSDEIIITLDPNYGGAETSFVKLSDGQTFSYPEAPARKGYAFKGWYTDSACTEEYDFTGTISEGMTLYAGWTRVNISAIDPYVTIVSNTQIDPSKYPTILKSYTFHTGDTFWEEAHAIYLTAQEDGKHRIYFSNSSNATSFRYYLEICNLTTGEVIRECKAVSSKASDSVSFDCEAGDIIALLVFRENGASYAQFYFEGFGEFESSAKASIKGFIYNEDSTYTQKVAFDASYTLPVPTRKGYTFLGWYTGETKLESGVWNSTSDITLTAKWEPDPTAKSE